MPRADKDLLGAPDRDRIRQAVHDSAAVEVATATGRRPQTFPLSPFYDESTDRVVVTSAPAFAGKIEAVKENPRLSLLFYDADDPFLLRGRATVRDDDLEANTEYLQELIAAEPPSPKRDAFTKTSGTLDSRLGRFLFGWYALRILVEIEPVAIESVSGDACALPAWPAYDVDAAEAASYDRVTLTAVDEAGWPRTDAVHGVDVDGETARLDVPLSVEDGQPACLLAHWHTPGLDKLGQRLFRGRVRSAEGRVAFDPASTFSMRNETLLDRLKFIVQGKRRTRAYFADREG
ncbi:pyridoxamine 5'-phosphate oxidase family protein [Natronomonas halophila]|uniref:pyridoxamine 5'-phosphate oxidase family protein n=1 Tax=Natronomonas halophila TaxID=2747817 RepID=UPI0015B670FF|nr:pyridoxamine 5'-phosphate oxidase family protein [Natronomonas halophila]QLD87239.1 pyridoxamine 5'-phosphate oxidase family protein [Natronomonas halophila]